MSEEQQQVVTKTKAKAKAKQELAPDVQVVDASDQELKLKVDTIGTLYTEVQAAKNASKKMDELRKDLLKLTTDQPSAEEIVFEGQSHVVVFSSCSDTRTITDVNGLIGVLKEKLGYEGLLALLKISLSDVDTYLSAAESAPFISHVTGGRTMKKVLEIEEAKKLGLV